VVASGSVASAGVGLAGDGAAPDGAVPAGVGAVPDGAVPAGVGAALVGGRDGASDGAVGDRVGVVGVGDQAWPSRVWVWVWRRPRPLAMGTAITLTPMIADTTLAAMDTAGVQDGVLVAGEWDGADGVPVGVGAAVGGRDGGLPLGGERRRRALICGSVPPIFARSCPRMRSCAQQPLSIDRPSVPGVLLSCMQQ